MMNALNRSSYQPQINSGYLPMNISPGTMGGTGGNLGGFY
jgi:hypothetical protein